MPLVIFKFNQDLQVQKEENWWKIDDRVIDIFIVSGIDEDVCYPKCLDSAKRNLS